MAKYEATAQNAVSGAPTPENAVEIVTARNLSENIVCVSASHAMFNSETNCCSVKGNQVANAIMSDATAGA